MNSKTEGPTLNRTFRRYAEAISRKLQFRGPWFFQLKSDSKGKLKLLEIAPRIGGAMATHRVLGVNFALLSIFEREGVELELLLNDYPVEIDRALVNRYVCDIRYDTVYVDYDDTLIIDGGLNLELIAFLYQAAQAGRKLILLTRSLLPVMKTLRARRLDRIFDRVVHIKPNEQKADYINPQGAIFIDDSFSERKAVHARHGIRTFDCSMIELLRDWRA